ncbi:MAG: HepT-like ribonuclease domain-containing protein [Candidatus Hydrogenedentota bacterium]
MIQKYTIARFISKIQEEKKLLEEVILKEAVEFLQDQKVIRATKYSIIIIVESMLNILQHILAKEKRVVIQSYNDALTKAGAYGILTLVLSEKLRFLVKLRNEYLLHGYWKCDDLLLFNLIKDNIEDIDAFVLEIKKYIS